MTTDGKNRILDKIKKLLRMKRGGTPDEIATALALAAELARKHDIDLDSIDPDAVPAQPIGHIDAVTSARIQWECKYAGMICQKFFNVTMLLRQGGKVRIRGWRYVSDYVLTFIGLERDIQIAIYVYRFLVGHFRRCWNTRSSRCRNRRAFLWGMYLGVFTKLEEQYKQQVNESGLIFIGRQVALRDDYMRATWGETTGENLKPDSDASAAENAGFVAGRKTEIRAALAPSGQARLQLTQ